MTTNLAHKTLNAITISVILSVIPLQTFGQGVVEETPLPCDIEKGTQVYSKCKSCHTVNGTEIHLAGPDLQGVLGRPTASAKGYQYSRGMRRADFVWNEDTLHKFLESPQEFVPRTKMAFAGLKKEADRRAVICYLGSR